MTRKAQTAEAQDTITPEEMEAIRQWKAEMEAQQAAEREAKKSLEQRYLDAFERFTEEPGTLPHAMELLAGVAAFFHDDDPALRQEGTIDEGQFGVMASEPNIAQYVQKIILGGICNQADWAYGMQDQRCNFLAAKAARARRAYAGGEIDTLTVRENEIAYARVKQVTLPLAADWLKAAKAAYLAQFGEEWVKPVGRNGSVEDKRTVEQNASVYEKRSRL